MMHIFSAQIFICCESFKKAFYIKFINWDVQILSSYTFKKIVRYRRFRNVRQIKSSHKGPSLNYSLRTSRIRYRPNLGADTNTTMCLLDQSSCKYNHDLPHIDHILLLTHLDLDNTLITYTSYVELKIVFTIS